MSNYVKDQVSLEFKSANSKVQVKFIDQLAGDSYILPEVRW